ncbi:hypothetical protein [Brevibacillus sp. MER 51]|uniref:hypothetical protein n=1 Tax=Brevibacillus sp. MER 51 TaxID=2939560 RepID=UPI00203DC755|nr:hypothetical protein [Brevibacillus sp. MER 51]MCM3141702.1 hypothetical protein [Brevibacillus sp. MER 51]
MNTCDLCGEYARQSVTLMHGMHRFDGHERCMEQIKKMLDKEAADRGENPEVYPLWPNRDLNVPRRPAEPSQDEYPEAWKKKLVY